MTLDSPSRGTEWDSRCTRDNLIVRRSSRHTMQHYIQALLQEQALNNPRNQFSTSCPRIYMNLPIRRLFLLTPVIRRSSSSLHINNTSSCEIKRSTAYTHAGDLASCRRQAFKCSATVAIASGQWTHGAVLRMGRRGLCWHPCAKWWWGEEVTASDAIANLKTIGQ